MPDNSSLVYPEDQDINHFLRILILSEPLALMKQGTSGKIDRIKQTCVYNGCIYITQFYLYMLG